MHTATCPNDSPIGWFAPLYIIDTRQTVAEIVHPAQQQIRKQLNNACGADAKKGHMLYISANGSSSISMFARQFHHTAISATASTDKGMVPRSMVGCSGPALRLVLSGTVKGHRQRTANLQTGSCWLVFLMTRSPLKPPAAIRLS